MRRAVALVEQLVIVLRRDPRLHQAYADYVAFLRSTGNTPANPDDPGFWAAATYHVGWGLVRFRRLVRDELQTYPWLVKYLWYDFVQYLLHRNDLPHGFALELADDVGGRAPKVRSRGDTAGSVHYLRRDAEWFYRRYIKRPPDTTHTLAREWAELRKRDDEDKVRTGTVIPVLQRTKRLLDAVN